MGRKTGVAAVVVLLAIAANKYRSTKTLSPILEISTGKLQGIETYTRGGKKIYEYMRINFAKPPVGNLRFEVTGQIYRFNFKLGKFDEMGHGNFNQYFFMVVYCSSHLNQRSHGRVFGTRRKWGRNAFKLISFQERLMALRTVCF